MLVLNSLLTVFVLHLLFINVLIFKKKLSSQIWKKYVLDVIWLFFTPCLSASFPLLIKSMKSMIHSNSSSNPGYQVQSLIFGMFSPHLFKGLTSDMTCIDCITVTATILGIRFPVLWTDICICEFSLLYCVISRRWEGNKQKYILPLQLTRSVTLNKLPFYKLLFF